jgi:hypothetical protein
MADYNNHSHLLAEKRLLALDALEVVRRHDEIRMTKLNSDVLDLTSELASVQNERDEDRAEMVRRGYIQPENIRPGERTNLHPGDEQEFAAGIENRHTADAVCALAMAIQQLNTRMTELISHIDELNVDLAYVTYERDEMRYWLASSPWGRFRLRSREAFRDSKVVTDERPIKRGRFMLGVMGPLSLPVCSQSKKEETL